MKSVAKLVTLSLFAILVSAHDLPIPASAAPSADTRKLAFLIPYLYGTGGLTLPNPTHEAHFNSAFQNNFAPFNTAIASQLTSLPIPSPASGFTYTFDKSLGVYSRSAQSFGPILAERAETIGKDKVFFGFSFQNFTFDSLDGLSLNRIPVVFEHIPNPANPVFARDVITTENFLDVQISQTTTFLTYGLHDRIDISVAVPIIGAKVGAISNATIQRIGTAGDPTIHSFASGSDQRQATFSNFGSASGIGDLVARIKATAIKTERLGLAAGMDTRLPTGDPYDFLGSGSTGLKPFAALSFNANRFSPHVNVAYQWNGNSVLAGNVVSGAKAELPSQLFYSAGFDAGITKRFTLATDYLGQRVTEVDRVAARTFTAGNGQQFEHIAFNKGSFTSSAGSVGIKVNAVGNLLASFNVLFRIGEGGLQDKVTPLIGLSYAF